MGLYFNRLANKIFQLILAHADNVCYQLYYASHMVRVGARDGEHAYDQ